MEVHCNTIITTPYNPCLSFNSMPLKGTVYPFSVSQHIGNTFLPIPTSGRETGGGTNSRDQDRCFPCLLNTRLSKAPLWLVLCIFSEFGFNHMELSIMENRAQISNACAETYISSSQFLCKGFQDDLGCFQKEKQTCISMVNSVTESQDPDGNEEDRTK